MQHETALGLDRPAMQHGAIDQRPIHELDRELSEHLAERQVARSVDHDAERAFGIVLADVSDRLREIGIGHRWHRDQEVIL